MSATPEPTAADQAYCQALLEAKDRQIRELRESNARELQAVWDHAHKLDDALQQLNRFYWSTTYHADSLAVWNKDTTFLQEPAFVKAYQAGMNSGHKINREKGSTADIHIEWRVHVICWAAWHAKHLEGSFVECGVNTGIYSLAACHFIDLNATGKDFYLFDTFKGIPEEQMTEQEREVQVAHNRERYEECYELARQNFSAFPRARLIRGTIPESLSSVCIERVCYLSIDMNIVKPEIAAMRHFWDKLVRGAVVVLDDYGWTEHALQKQAMDAFAEEKGVRILHLPTGQGLILKP
jgi:hypothetical protein